ncbi:MAG: methyltransferase [Dysgonamonadaceae bacterium]|nr:methyltransferase [Dysgonamonadaceae bacterium]
MFSFLIRIDMSNSFFYFKQFTVYHDLCAMKVGTDGVLLGAWTDCGNAANILDVGSGSGLIALMLAQRSGASIDAVDIDGNACEQSAVNFGNSPFAARLKIHRVDFNAYFPAVRYDLIVSNPPYFARSLKSPDAGRCVARHAEKLSFEDLFGKSAALLTGKGRLSLILPADTFDRIQSIAGENNLFLRRKTTVRPHAASPPKRILLEYSKEKTQPEEDELLIEKAPRVYSDEYRALTSDYYPDRPFRC